MEHEEICRRLREALGGELGNAAADLIEKQHAALLDIARDREPLDGVLSLQLCARAAPNE
jgi:hypothetical protein